VAQANSIPNTKLSDLFLNPAVREAFRRAEPDYGSSAFAVPATPPRVLDGGAVESVLLLCEVRIFLRRLCHVGPQRAMPRCAAAVEMRSPA
jgi:hypothetical protein